MHMTWAELFLKSRPLRETRLLMKMYKFWETFRAGNDLIDPFIQLLHGIDEKLLPRKAKLSCPRPYSHLLAKLTLKLPRPPRFPNTHAEHFSLLLYHLSCSACFMKSIYAIIIYNGIFWKLCYSWVRSLQKPSPTSQTLSASPHSLS